MSPTRSKFTSNFASVSLTSEVLQYRQNMYIVELYYLIKVAKQTVKAVEMFFSFIEKKKGFMRS